MKEQTAPGAAPWELRWPEREVMRRALVPALFVALALLVTLGYGTGIQLNDGQADLHLDPLKFLGTLMHAWNPALYLGTHTGYWFPYETPYAWFYGLAELLHVPQVLAQRFAVFLVYTGCLASMYYCLRSVAPWLNETARVAGSVAFLFNLYVALNSQAQIVWLMVYATLPAMVAITARSMRGEINPWKAALGIGLLVLVGGGVNPPLVAINVFLIAIYVIVMLVLSEEPLAVLRRTFPFALAAAVAAFLINLYWVVPFVDYFRNTWLNGVLSEGPSMHNAATSFENVLRGLGHWATFVSFFGHAYFPWAAPYASGFFGALLWFVPIVALGGIAMRRNQRPPTLYFLAATIISVPIVVGYYHDALGDAVTTPVYDAFYRYFPGFQMFRFSYKWIAGVEFGMSGLYGLSTFAVTSYVRERFARIDWLPLAVGVLLVAMPIFTFIPVIVYKMNYPGPVLPSWEYRENALVGQNQDYRVALFPTQFLEQFDWGKPQFYIENSLVSRPMVYGLLGSEPSQGTDLWVRRAYRATREGLPFAASMFRVLGVDTFLQRDDFIPVIDFSSPDESRYNSTTLTHDLLHRVIGATQVRSDGPLRVYHLNGALPLIYGVNHPVISTAPTFTEAALGNIDAMARGEARFDPMMRSAADFSSTLRTLSPILPASAAEIRNLAVEESLPDGVRIHPASAEASWTIPFELKYGARYAVFARDESLLFPKDPPATLSVDDTNFTPQNVASWTYYGQITLSAARHFVSDGYVDPDLVVAIVRVDDLVAWQQRITALTAELPHNGAVRKSVQDFTTTVTVPSAGLYRVSASAIGIYGPDGVPAIQVARSRAVRGVFPAKLGATLPYLFDTGVVGSSELMMPDWWYRSNPDIYRWQRGDPESWFLFPRVSHVRVFASSGGLARTAMRISRIAIGDVLTIVVNGRRQQTLTLVGVNSRPEVYDNPDDLQGPAPVPLSFTLSLRPGWNDVSFAFSSAGGQRGDLRPGIIAAAVAPDLSFTRIGALPTPAGAPATDASFTAQALAQPLNHLVGDPDLTGTINSSGAETPWVAVALASGNAVTYRLFPLPQQGSFNVNFLHAFPNSWYDGFQRVAGIWVLSRGGSVSFSGLFYNLHALPARRMGRPRDLSAAPLTIDGKPIGNKPVFLRRGRHLVASADWQVKMNLLTIAPVTLPPTHHFSLAWQQRSATGIDVAVGANSKPFLLVFGSAFHPEWQATVNGQVLDHVIVNGLSNGWIVPDLPDGGTISLRFVAERYYTIAAAISLIALILLIGLAIKPDLWPIRPPNS